MGWADELGRPPRVVVTGGAGFIGSLLSRILLDAGYEVLVYDNLSYGGQSLLPLFIHDRFRFVEADILDTDTLGAALENADAVVHLAAMVGYPLCKKLPDLAQRVNVQGTRNVLSALPKDARLLYASTGSNYGEVVGLCTEETPLNPLSLYGETKTLAESLCRGWPESVSLRFATAFGLSPRPRLDLMINDFTYQALVQRYLLVYEKHFRRTFIHVRDIARAFLHCMEQWDQVNGRVFNVGDESMNYTKEDIANMLANRLDFHLYYAEFAKDEDKRDYEVCYDRIRATGFSIDVNIDKGLQELIAGLPLLRVKNPFGNV